MLDLSGRVAIVTGGTRGIGRAIADALVAAGARVAIGARSAGDVREAAASMADEGRVIGVECDVRRHADCEKLIGATLEAFGRVDILVNNAGVGGFVDVADMSIEQWHAILETNLNGVFYCCRTAIPHLRGAGDAWIVNIGSLAGRNAFPGGAAYNASKFGLLGFSEALMQEVRHDGIRVTCIMPGSVATEFNDRAPSAEDAWKIQPEDIARIVLDLLAMPARTLASRVEVRPSRPPRR
jgi:3-oxoacyl-[acyl-carrier protein] reductase